MAGSKRLTLESFLSFLSIKAIGAISKSEKINRNNFDKVNKFKILLFIRKGEFAKLESRFVRSIFE